MSEGDTHKNIRIDTCLKGTSKQKVPCHQVHVLVRVPSVGVCAGHLRNPAGDHEHPPLELRREQQEEDKQEDDHPQPLGQAEAGGVRSGEALRGGAPRQ